MRRRAADEEAAPAVLRAPRPSGASAAAAAAGSGSRASVFGSLTQSVRKIVSSKGSSSSAAAHSAVVAAARQNDRNALVTLLNGGDDVDGRDGNGGTALFYAAEDGNVAVVAICLERDADINAKNAVRTFCLSLAHLT